MATITHITTPDGVTHDIGGGGGGTNTTYDLTLGTLSSNTVPIKLVGSDGTTDTVNLKGAGSATLSVSGSTITITTSSGQTITYTLSGSGDTTTYTITATPSSGTATSTTIPAATQSAAGVMTSADKTKLDGITSGAEPNQNAFSYVKVGNTTISADTTTDTLELAAGTNISLVPDATNDKVTISAIGGGGGGGLTFDDIYPVGSIYMSINNVNPGLLFGGTWTQIQDTFLLAAGSTYTAGSIGGESTHTLTESELPNVTGYFDLRRWGSGQAVTDVSGMFTSRGYASTGSANPIASSSTGAATPQHITTSFGSGDAHNNMPPYLAVYIWKREPDSLVDLLVDDNNNNLIDSDGNYIEIA